MDEFSRLLQMMAEQHEDIAPAKWPPADLDRLIDGFRDVATEAFHDHAWLDFVLSAGLAFACRNARFLRRHFGLFGGYR
jgi:hypothetical protein